MIPLNSKKSELLSEGAKSECNVPNGNRRVQDPAETLKNIWKFNIIS